LREHFSAVPNIGGGGSLGKCPDNPDGPVLHFKD
jgi:hypothetical protein